MFSRTRPRVIFFSVRVLFLGVILIISANFLLLGSEEGLVYSLAEKDYSSVQLEMIIKETENNSVIITQYHDKLFFPERKVIVGNLTDNSMNILYSKLTSRLPVYYYSFTFPEVDIDYLNSRKLSEAGLKIKPIKKINKDFTLYKLTSKD